MTVSASEIQNIRNGLYTHLTTCGPYAGNEVSACDFGIIEGAAGSAIMFMPGQSTLEPLAFGGYQSRDDNRKWGISGAVFVKDTGDPTAYNAAIWQAHDDFVSTMSKDNSLGGKCQNSRIRSLNYPGTATDRQGQAWGIVSWVLEVENF